jgi:transcription elongation factor Elf1
MLKELKSKLTYIKSDKKHHTFRCPFCGDSANKKHGHLNVSRENPVFRCVRCGTGGHIKVLLNEVGLENIELPEHFEKTEVSKAVSKNINIAIPKENDLEETIIKYMKKRTGFDNLPDELNILSLKNYNNIFSKILRTKYGENLKHFDEGIPFLTCNHRKVIMRVLNNDSFRYYNYVLEDGRDSYVIKNKISMSEFRRHKTVVFAEGIFDIINQYLNQYISVPKNTIYTAALNSSLSNAYKTTRALSLCYYPNIIILADNDKTDKEYLSTIKYSSVTIYRNKNGKDFGDYDNVVPVKSFEK